MWVLGGHKFKSLLKLSNGWTDWHQIWHTCEDSSGNGYTPNKLPFETQGALGGLRGSNIQKSGESVKRLDRLAPTLVHVCGFIWEWTSYYNSENLCPSVRLSVCPSISTETVRTMHFALGQCVARNPTMCLFSLTLR